MRQLLLQKNIIINNVITPAPGALKSASRLKKIVKALMKQKMTLMMIFEACKFEYFFRCA